MKPFDVTIIKRVNDLPIIFVSGKFSLIKFPSIESTMNEGRSEMNERENNYLYSRPLAHFKGWKKSNFMPTIMGKQSASLCSGNRARPKTVKDLPNLQIIFTVRQVSGAMPSSVTSQIKGVSREGVLGVIMSYELSLY